MKLSEYSIKKPITTIMISLSVMVMGLISLSRLPLEYLPSVSFPFLAVSISYPSSSPEEVDRLITRPVEEALATLSGVVSFSSRSSSTGSSIRMEFPFGADMDLVSIQIRDRLDQVRSLLPDDVERINIERRNTEDFPILEYSITWLGEDQSELLNVYEQTILPRIQRINGVASVELEGIEEKALLVNVDQSRMNAHGIDFRSINNAISRNNTNISAGYVNDASRRLPVRAMGEIEAVEQIRDMPLRNDINIGDVASVSHDFTEVTRFERLDGNKSVNLEIQKSSTANLLETVQAVKAEMNAILDEIGKDKIKAHTVRDRSIDITQGITGLSQSALTGGVLAIVAIFIFLRNFRSTIIIGSAIPISVLCVFMIMFLLRQFANSTLTLNLISMMGLMVAIGMLVDPAVVALENIYRKRYDEGLNAWDAALEGAEEIGMPVLAASLTTICVFIPMIFIANSFSSLFMKDFAITIVVSVIASFCVALTLVPLAASRAFKSETNSQDRVLKSFVFTLAFGALAYHIYTTGVQKSLTWAQESIIGLASGLTTMTWVSLTLLLGAIGFVCYRYRHIGIKTLYARIITTTLRYRWTTVTVACILLGVGFHLYSQLEVRSSRRAPNRAVRITVEIPRSFSIEEAREVFTRAEAALIPHKTELDIEAIGSRYSTRGRGRRGGNRITLYLTPAEESTLTTGEAQKRALRLLPRDIPGVRFKTGGFGRSSAVGAGIELKGRDEIVLAMLAEDVELGMQGMRGVHEVETSLESGDEEIRVTVNRQRAQRYGLSPFQVANTIAQSLGSRGGSKFKTPNGEIDITVQLREEDRKTLEQLKNASFESSQGGMVTFSSVADFNYQPGRRSIRREDRMSTVTVFANTEAEDALRIGRMMRGRMQSVPLPNGYAWKMDRGFRRLSQEQGDTDFTMYFAVLLIYLIMASLFESYIHPFTILFCISFAFVGVAIGFYTLGIALDSSAMSGLLVLFGIVVNNGIVLVDHINRYRHQGLFRRDAIIRGGTDRLRPIMMTATTTIIGLAPLVIPMLYGTAEGNARRWGPIGLVVVCGLAFSTVLTLILLPTVYSLMDDLSRYGKRIFATAKTA